MNEEQLWQKILEFLKEKTSYDFTEFAVATEKYNQDIAYTNPRDIFFAIKGSGNRFQLFRNLSNLIRFEVREHNVQVAMSYDRLSIRGNGIRFDLILIPEEDLMEKIKEGYLKPIEKVIDIFP